MVSARRHDCVTGRRCYRSNVATFPQPSHASWTAAFLALMLATAGCATTGTGSPSQQIAPAPLDAPAAAAPDQEPWWHQAGDPVLAGLIEQGMAANPELTCRIAVLHEQDREDAASAKTWGATLKRLFAKDAIAREQAERDTRVRRLADRRVQLAQRIALAYIEVRRLQQIHALRAGVLGQYSDNADIAEFRRQAGLVPAVDSALARSQDETARAELGYTDGRLNDAIAALAQLVGEEPGALVSRVGETGALPAALDDAGAMTADAEREKNLATALDAARRTAKDARTAYREGAGDFATLYVAEVAVLSLEQAQVDVRAERAAGTIRQWSAQSDDWARSDIERPVPPPATSAPPAKDSHAGDCD